MNSLKGLGILVLLGFIACTQFVENEKGKNSYSGTDGCVYCHTNEARLKVLAPEEESGESAGGG